MGAELTGRDGCEVRHGRATRESQNPMPKKRIISFSPGHIPGHQWSLTLTPPLSRSLVPTFCDRLREVAHERDGFDFYYPGFPAGGTTARFEWYERQKGDRFALRVGIAITIEAGDVSEFNGYAEHSVNAVKRPRQPIQLNASDLAQARAAVSEVAMLAMARIATAPTLEFQPVFHVLLPVHKCFDSVVVTDDGTATIFPPRIVGSDNSRVSAVARAAGLRAFSLVNAFLTLAHGAPFKPARISWPVRTPAPEMLSERARANLDKLYPPTRRVRRIGKDEYTSPDPFLKVWSAAQRVPDLEGSALENAIFAYYRALDLGGAGTLSGVCLIAALGALAKPLVRWCTGVTTCSEHGQRGPHPVTGDAAAIIEHSVAALGRVGQRFEVGELKKVVRRLYSEQRSAYAHEAVTRHGENYPSRMPSWAGPGASGPVSSEHQRVVDLRYLTDLTRRVILSELGWVSGCDVTAALPSNSLRADAHEGGEVRIPKGTVLRMDFREPPDVASSDTELAPDAF